MKDRSPKSENRNPSTTFVQAVGVPAGAGGDSRLSQSLRRSAFGFRISAFLRFSDFGLRFLTAALWLLAAQPLLAAATNSLKPNAIPPLRQIGRAHV